MGRQGSQQAPIPSAAMAKRPHQLPGWVASLAAPVEPGRAGHSAAGRPGRPPRWHVGGRRWPAPARHRCPSRIPCTRWRPACHCSPRPRLRPGGPTALSSHSNSEMAAASQAGQLQQAAPQPPSKTWAGFGELARRQAHREGWAAHGATAGEQVSPAEDRSAAATTPAATPAAPEAGRRPTLLSTLQYPRPRVERWLLGLARLGWARERARQQSPPGRQPRAGSLMAGRSRSVLPGGEGRPPPPPQGPANPPRQ